MTKIDNRYNVVIVGAGIGGLTCGCYLAKSGIKVLIVEQAPKVGGYCGSFYRKNFTFDYGIHCLGSFRKDGQLRKIYDDLNLSEFVNIIRVNPSEVVYGSDSKLYIFNDLVETIENLSKNYPKESRNIKNFFEEISNPLTLKNFTYLRKKTFASYLSKFFSDERLKNNLSILIWNMWIPASEIAALAGVTFFKEFIIDGGYYPLGGMQKFSNALAYRFEELGGDILLSKRVTRINVNNRTANGVEIDNGNHVEANFIVSNVDAVTTFFHLLKKEDSSISYLNKLAKLKQCESALVVYLAIKKLKETRMEKCTALWCIPNCYNNERINFDIVKSDVNRICFFMTCPTLYDRSLAPDDYDILTLICGANFASNEFWNNNKLRLSDLLIDKAVNLLPNLKSQISIKEIATPYTFEKYTLNYKGSVHGWESSIKQTLALVIKPASHIKNLFFSGHWVMQTIGTGGVSTAAYIGKSTAKRILWLYKKGQKSEYIFNTTINR